MKKLLPVFLCGMSVVSAWAQESAAPVRLAIVGLTHDHVRGFLPELLKRTDVRLAGIVETDQALIAQIAERYHLDASLFFPSLEALRARTSVQGVASFGSTFDHRKVVEQCAPLGIPVMVEKPLAVSLADAKAIAAAARKGGIQVYVNYETTWYPGTHAAYDLVRRQHALGDVRKIVVHDGHSGPAAICSPFFLAWLTDPVLDGGGAVMDFGCYGADLATWLMDGQRPTSVFAVTQQLQPDVYPKVDDEATIVLTYPRAQAIIQASWNWPVSRKDMEIYGQTGALRLPDRSAMFLRKPGDDREIKSTAPALAAPQADSISYFAAIVRGQIKSEGLGSLETNLIVNEILEAAKESARTGKRVELGAEFGTTDPR
jgi:predicted dehydrogenase